MQRTVAVKKLHLETEIAAAEAPVVLVVVFVVVLGPVVVTLVPLASLVVVVFPATGVSVVTSHVVLGIPHLVKSSPGEALRTYMYMKA